LAEIDQAVSLIQSRSRVRPAAGIILGSGLDPLAEEVESPVAIRYSEIPGFPGTTVPGHRGEMILGIMEGVGVAVFRGRAHMYEGYTPQQMTYPVRLLHALGAGVMLATNAAGGLNPAFVPGTPMVITDHIFLPGMAGMSPLMGAEAGSERFVDMSAAYDSELRAVLLEHATAQDIRVEQGCYIMLAGPSFETPAEARMLRMWGADAVGMSTVPEVVMARRLGMRVAAISCITNSLLGESYDGEVAHEEVLDVAQKAAPAMISLLHGLLHHLGKGNSG